MTILFINSIGKNKWGGGEKWIITTAKGLQEKGHDISIGCRKNSILEKKAKEYDLKTFLISYNTDFSFFSVYKYYKYFKRTKTTCIICSLNRDVRIAGLAAKIAGNIAIIGRQGVQLIKNKWKYKFTFKYIDGIITNSFSLKTIYDSFGWWDKDFVSVIHNGISEKQDDSNSVNLFKILPIEKDAKIILSAGRLSKQKGFKYLIDAAALAKKHGKNWMFIVAGEGKLKNQLNQSIHKLNLQTSFKILGFIDSLNPLLMQSDIFVLPSLYEGMPNVLLEAMILGVPVIATPVNGSSELIKDGVTGSLVPVKDGKAIFEMLERNFADPKNMKEKAIQAKSHVSQYFSVSSSVNRIESYLLEKTKNTINNNKPI